MDDIVQCMYEKARMGVLSVVYNVVEQIQCDLLALRSAGQDSRQAHRQLFRPGDNADKICGKILFKNAFMDPIAAFIHRRTGETVAAERVTMKMEKQLKALMMDSDVKCVTQKSVSPPDRTDSAPSCSPLDKNDDVKADRCRSEH